MPIDFPDKNPSRFGYWQENASRGGGVALNGYEQTVLSGTGRWRAGGVWHLRSKDEILTFRAFFGLALGRGQEIFLPAFDGKRANWPIEETVAGSTGRMLHPGITRDRRLDGTIYEDPAVPAVSEITATVNADIERGEQQIGINMTQGSELRAGQYFGLGNRLYLITEIVSVVGTVTTVNFWPAARAVAMLGDPVKLTRPRCVMKLLTDDHVLKELAGLRFADIALEFRESL